MKKVILMLCAIVALSSCSENYSNGERIGTITQMSRKGRFFKSWEGHLNATQTGNNSSASSFDFSIDNDNEDPGVINAIDSAAQHGWKVKLTYHEVSGKNWWSNRGETDRFVTGVQVLDKNFSERVTLNGGTAVGLNDTVWVVVDKNEIRNQLRSRPKPVEWSSARDSDIKIINSDGNSVESVQTFNLNKE